MYTSGLASDACLSSERRHLELITVTALPLSPSQRTEVPLRLGGTSKPSKVALSSLLSVVHHVDQHVRL